MKIAIFVPNLSKNSGGAETYALGMARVLSEHHEIVFYTRATKSELSIDSVYKRYGLPKFETRFVSFLHTGGHEVLKEIGYRQLRPMLREIEQEFDLFINCTFGRLPGPEKIQAIHIVHFPDRSYSSVFPGVFGRRMQEKYLKSYDLILCNSEFTRGHFQQIWGAEAEVLNPPIQMEPISEKELDNKENIILAVDRLVPDKKVKEMAEAFFRFSASDRAGYRMVIIGNRDSKHPEYYEELSRMTEGTNIQILSNVPYAELVRWYRKAKVFWHAKGLGISEDRPAEMEHFGMTTVEAMAGGTVPVVIDKAGQKEIVIHGETGYRWETEEELMEYTRQLTEHETVLQEMQRSVIVRAQEFLMPAFREKLQGYMNRLFEGSGHG